MSKGKKYAYIDTNYKGMLVPLNVLEKLMEEAILVSTEYVDGDYILRDPKVIRKFEIYSQEDLDTAYAQAALEGK